MIIVYKGLPGSGKTASLAHFALQELSRGRDVWSNFWLDYEGDNLRYWSSIEELLEVENGLIIMDEAQIYLNSRLWELLPQQFQYKLQLHRHDGLDIYGTVQHEARLDVVMRELVSMYIQCTFWRFHPLPFPRSNMILQRAYYPEDVKSVQGVPFHTKRIPLSAVKRKYDTMQKLKNVDMEKGVVTVRYRVCNMCGSRRKIG